MSESTSTGTMLKSLFFRARSFLFWQGPTAAEVLQREHNNFDLLRLFAASAVVLGHAFFLSPKPGFVDPTLRLIQINFSGGLAVATFFFLSGFLVFDSFQRAKSASRFFAARIARIFPGLSICLAFSVLVVGPLFTSLDRLDYVTSPELLGYYRSNLFFINPQSTLPGVFTHSTFKLNGCLWTLPSEVRLYLLLGLFGVLGFFRRPIIANITIGAGIAASLFPFDHIPYFQHNGEDAVMILLTSFALGCLAAINKRSIKLTSALFIALLISCAVTWAGPARPIFFYLTLYYGALYLFSTPWSLRIKLPGDYSYGIYIYGFVVQQCVASLQTSPNPWVNLCISLPITLVLASLSWHLIEHPAMRLLKASPEYCAQIWRIIRREGALPVRNFVLSAIVFLLMVVPAAIPFPKDSGVMTYRSTLRIISISPSVIKAGVDFNLQPNGRSAIVMIVSRPVDQNAAVVLAGIPLASGSTATTMVAFVPNRLYAKPGNLTLAIQEPMSGGGVQISEARALSVVSAQ
jgi:peptidoglycan/LPS O-acetylase OafA/YrhL